MSSIPRASALRLASTGRELGAEALRGLLEQNDDGRWTISHITVKSWLSRHAGQEVILVMAAIDAETAAAYTRICRTCGNEYEGQTCPHCDAVRRRLRGG